CPLNGMQRPLAEYIITPPQSASLAQVCMVLATLCGHATDVGRRTTAQLLPAAPPLPPVPVPPLPPASPLPPVSPCAPAVPVEPGCSGEVPQAPPADARASATADTAANSRCLPGWACESLGRLMAVLSL